MVPNGLMAESAQPCQMMILPPACWKADRLGSVASFSPFSAVSRR